MARQKYKIFLSEVTTEITQKENAKSFDKCQDAAKRGGRVAGKARIETEKEIGKKVVSTDNYPGIRKKLKSTPQ